MLAQFMLLLRRSIRERQGAIWVMIWKIWEINLMTLYKYHMNRQFVLFRRNGGINHRILLLWYCEEVKHERGWDNGARRDQTVKAE